MAVALLTINGRTDAATRPSGQDLNKATAVHVRSVDWDRFRYSALIVLGIGPEDPVTRLSDGGKANLRLAVDRYRRGLAPLIVVSGGAVHPRRTDFVEAIEMRRELVDRYRIPADAIVVEPLARHTTTNLRNAARELSAMGVPLDKDVLVLTNAAHSASISAPSFVTRNEKELGYQPGKVVARLSPTDLVYRLSPSSLRIDPRDPLDP